MLAQEHGDCHDHNRKKNSTATSILRVCWILAINAHSGILILLPWKRPRCGAHTLLTVKVLLETRSIACRPKDSRIFSRIKIGQTTPTRLKKTVADVVQDSGIHLCLHGFTSRSGQSPLSRIQQRSCRYQSLLR
jgi:hypothetical protein